MVERIYFESSNNLTQAVKWLYMPEKSLAASSALRHIHLQQVDSDYSQISAFCLDNVWMYRKCKSQGVIGTEFLFDPEDLLTRVDKGEVWKRTSMSIHQTKKNKMNIEAVTEILDDQRVRATGNILIPTFAGDLGEFSKEEVQWKHLCTLRDGWTYRHACRLVTDFSKLKGDTGKRAVWFRIEKGILSICTTERGSERGDNMLAYEMPLECTDIRFGFLGKYLSKTAEVFQENSVIEVSIEDRGEEEPTRIKFEGDVACIELPLIEGYYCQALSRGAMTFFYGEGVEIETVAERTFNLIELIDSVSLQTPKKGHAVKDVVFKMLGEELVQYKRFDIHQEEMSMARTWTLEGIGEWQPIVLDHLYITDALEALDKHITAEMKNLQIVGELEIEYEEAEDLFLGLQEKSVAKLVTLTEARCVHKNNCEQWLLFLQSSNYPNCRIKSTGNTLSKTVDRVEE